MSALPLVEFFTPDSEHLYRGLRFQGITLLNARKQARGMVQRVDHECGCAKTAWQFMGSPVNLRRDDVEQIQEMARPAVHPLALAMDEHGTTFEITLNPHALCYVEIRNAFEDDPGL